MIEPLDALELAELLDFTADAISWPNATIIHADLQAHLRRWARRLEPPNSSHGTLDEPHATEETAP